MGRIVALALGAIVLSACATGSAGTTPRTSLTITYWANGTEAGEPQRWTLRCNPNGGTLPRPGVACRRLAASGMRPFAPLSGHVACTEIWGGPQVARVVGNVNGRSVWATFNRTNGCHISRWDGVSPWLLPPGGA